MQNIDLKSQEPGRESHLNLNYFCASEPAISNQQLDDLPEPTTTQTTANLAGKKPSLSSWTELFVYNFSLQA